MHRYCFIQNQSTKFFMCLYTIKSVISDLSVTLTCSARAPFSESPSSFIKHATNSINLLLHQNEAYRILNLNQEKIICRERSFYAITCVITGLVILNLLRFCCPFSNYKSRFIVVARMLDNFVGQVLKQLHR